MRNFLCPSWYNTATIQPDTHQSCRAKDTQKYVSALNILGKFMSYLVIGLILFFAVHSVSIVARDFRNRWFTRSPLLWKSVYSVIALLGFYFIVTGYAQARLDPTVLYTPPVWTRHITMLLMLPVFPLLVATYLPGKIKAKLKHPMLVATKLWALSHLLANGMLADVLLFGAFLIWAVVDRIAIKRRQEPVEPLVGKATYDIIAIVVGLALYGVFVAWAHGALIGMPLFT